MRFLFTTQPGTGHLHPLLPVARGLRAAGHEVAFATSGAMAPDVATAGFAHHATGRPWLTSAMPQAFPEVAAIPPGPERYAWARRQIFAHDTALDVVPDLLRLAAWWPGLPHAVDLLERLAGQGTPAAGPGLGVAPRPA